MLVAEFNVSIKGLTVRKYFALKHFIEFLVYNNTQRAQVFQIDTTNVEFDSMDNTC